MSAAPISILDVVNDPSFLGAQFAAESWEAWKAFLAALFGLRMTDAQLALYRKHTGRTSPPAKPFREAALIIGRRGGKSRILALIAVYIACFVDHGPYLAPGEVATVAIVAADRRQARSVFRYVLGLLQAVPALASMIDGEPTAESIRLTNSVVIEIHTASFRVTRSYTLAAFIGDESAFWPAEDAASPDIEIFRAARPGLLTLPYSLLLMASSPYAKRGALWDAFRRDYGKDDARALVWKASTREMNPSADNEFIEEERARDPDSARAEYDAEFRDDIADFIDRQVIESLVIKGRHELPPISGITYRAFVDPSGGSSDSMTLGIAHHDPDTKRAVLDALRERRPPFSPEDVVTEFATLLKSYGIYRVHGDRYAGEWPRERFRAHGIEYRLSDRARSDIYRDVLPYLNSGAVELLDSQRLISQFCSLERRTARSGRDSIAEPPGSHDDVCNSAAGALLLVAMPKRTLPKPVAPLNVQLTVDGPVVTSARSPAPSPYYRSPVWRHLYPQWSPLNEPEISDA